MFGLKSSPIVQMPGKIMTSLKGRLLRDCKSFFEAQLPWNLRTHQTTLVFTMDACVRKKFSLWLNFPEFQVQGWIIGRYLKLVESSFLKLLSSVHGEQFKIFKLSLSPITDCWRSLLSCIIQKSNRSCLNLPCIRHRPQVALHALIHFLFLLQQTLQLKHHKTLLNNFARDVAVIRAIIHHPNKLCSLRKGAAQDWCTKLHYVVINFTAPEK